MVTQYYIVDTKITRASSGVHRGLRKFFELQLHSHQVIVLVMLVPKWKYFSTQNYGRLEEIV